MLKTIRKAWQLPQGWLSFLLLVAMLMLVVYSIQQAAWATSLQSALGILTPAALLGFAGGFLLARLRRIPRVLAHIAGTAGGIAWVVYLSGALRAVRPVPYLHPALQGWTDLASELLIRLIILWRNFVRGTSGEDVVLFVVILAFVAWLIGFLQAWFAFRSRWPAAAVGLPGFVILLNVFYGPRVPPGYFGAFVFLSLIFLIYYLWRQREENWKQQKVRYARELSWGVIWVGVAVSAILVLGTSFLPTTAGGAEGGTFWDQFLQPWREVRATWERLFSNVGGDPREGRLGAYGPSFGLGGARFTPEGIALEVRSNYNEYLRGISFDQYDGRGWTNTAEHGPTLPMSEDRTLQVPGRNRVEAWQIITPRLQGGNMVFAMAEPISVDLPAVAALSGPMDEVGFVDIVTVRSRSLLPEDGEYRVTSLLSAADKSSLRKARPNYSDWVRDRYLQLPSSLPQRVRYLADQIVGTRLDLTSVQSNTLPMAQVVGTTTNQGIQDITLRGTSGVGQGKEVTIQVDGDRVVGVAPSGGLVQVGLVNPYDAAEAIQNYLRDNMTYNEAIDPPPEEAVDVVDHFLFVSKAGYCDYFASGMVVLARTQGIPTRLIRGYAAGFYDREKEAYVVPVASAHSWVEVFFPEYGWQRFEPTAAGYTTMPIRPEEPPRENPEDPSSSSPSDSEGRDRSREDMLPEEVDFLPGPGGASRTGQAGQPLLLTGLILGGLFLAAASAGATLNFRIGRGLRRLSPAAAIYERMCRWADFVRLTPPGQPTPYETANFLAETLPEEHPEIDLITSLYVRERFGRYRPVSEELTEVRRAWQGLRWPLWRHWLTRLLPKKATEEPAEEVENERHYPTRWRPA